MQDKKVVKVKKVKKDYIYAVGRRKSAVARVRFYPDEKGGMEVNGVRAEEYFRGEELLKNIYQEPLRISNLIGKHKVTVKVSGSGIMSQIGALIHGLSRCLLIYNRERFHPVLKKRGFITRDPRVKERRKPGRGGSARHKVQSPRR